MNRLYAALLLSIALGCGAPPEVETPADEPTEAAVQPSELRLSDEAVARSEITTEKVQLISAPSVLLLPGQVALNEDRTVNAGAFVEGIVTECCTAEGTYVKEGQILAELHSHQTHELLGEYRSAQATVEARLSEQRLAEHAAARTRRLLDLKAGSERSVEQADSALEVAATAVVSAQAQLESSLAHFEYLGVETDELRRGEAPDHLRVVVRSPRNGVIVERTVTQGDVVSPSDVLYRIADLSEVWVLARASEQQLSRISTGMTANFQVRAYGDREFSGRVLRVSNSLDPDTKTIEVVVAITNPNRALKTGMYGDVELRSTSSDQVLAVPEDSVQLIDGQPTVFVATSGGVFEPREVTVGRSIDGMEEILSGIESGESVVVNGAFALKSDLLKSRFAEE